MIRIFGGPSHLLQLKLRPKPCTCWFLAQAFDAHFLSFLEFRALLEWQLELELQQVHDEGHGQRAPKAADCTIFLELGVDALQMTRVFHSPKHQKKSIQNCTSPNSVSNVPWAMAFVPGVAVSHPFKRVGLFVIHQARTIDPSISGIGLTFSPSRLKTSSAFGAARAPLTPSHIARMIIAWHRLHGFARTIFSICPLGPGVGARSGSNFHTSATFNFVIDDLARCFVQLDTICL